MISWKWGWSSVVYRGWDWESLVSGQNLVQWSVLESWFVNWIIRFVFGVLSNQWVDSGICNGSGVSTVVISDVVNGLDTSIRKVDLENAYI